jgi:hypothetical protein
MNRTSILYCLPKWLHIARRHEIHYRLYPLLLPVILYGREVERLLRGKLKKCGVTEQNEAGWQRQWRLV